jgi:Na+-transporting NADH:ubiquinone oxidoreductase subunit B
LAIEFGFATARDHEVNEGFLVSGMLIPLVIPVTTPLWMVAVATAFAVIIGKEVFGGTGYEYSESGTSGPCIFFFAYPSYLSGEVWIDTTLQEGQQLVMAFQGQRLWLYMASGEGVMPSDFIMFLGFIPGSIGETSTFAILLGAFILVATGIGSFRIMASVFLGGLLMGLLLNLFAK